MSFVNWKLLVALFVSPVAAFAQEVPGEEGPTDGPPLGDGPRELGAATPGEPARRVTLPALDATPFVDEDARWASVPAAKVDPRVAVSRRLHALRAPRRLRPTTRGVRTLPDGSLAWAAQVDSPGAVGMRLRVSRCDLPDGAELVVRAADGGEAYGPFVGRGPNDTGEFLLPTVFSASVRLELRVPAQAAGEVVLLAVDRVVHRYRERGANREDLRVGTTTKATACENDVACDASYSSDVARAVATMEIASSDGNVYLCSGCLLNDSDATTSVPYFLTAHHCVSTQYDATNTEFFFDYRAATCGGPAPALSSVPRVAGATVLVTSTTSDFTLLRLAGTLPTNRFFCGWTASRPNTGTSIVGVHHPNGGRMRISYGTLLDPDGAFHQVQWSSGITEPGSSGSPLFNPQKQLIGQLYGGSSTCSQRDGIDEYGRFDRTYQSISQYLGTGGSTTTDDPWDPTDDAAGGATTLYPTLFGAQHGPHSLSKADAADWFAFRLEGGARYRFFSTGVDDVRVVLHAADASRTVLASDDDSAGSLQFSLDVTPATTGDFLLEVTTAKAAVAADYALHHITVDPVPTRAPPLVAGLKRGVRGTAVTLRWRDAARNETGYYVELSEDGGGQWTRVGELPRNAHVFTHDVAGGAHLYRVGAWNVVGDPAIRWRRIAVVVVDPNQVDASDPADDVGSGATTLAPSEGGATPTRTLSRSDLEDWYRIDLVAGTRYQFQTTGGGDTYGDVFDGPSDANLVAVNNDAGPGRNFRIAFTAQRTGAFWLRVRARTAGAVLSYVLQWQRT
jgi:hypothetical protein